MKVNELFESDDTKSLDDWKSEVKVKHREYAGKIKFKGRQEGGKNLVSAEVPGMDRCFGVFDLDKMKGEVLGEGAKDEKPFLVKSKKHNQEMKVMARDKQHALDKVAVKDGNHYFTGPVGKDVSVEELDEALMQEKQRVKWHDSDAPDAKGKFRELGVDALADWLIKTRGGDMQKINGSLQQQITFNKNKDPAYARKMESVRGAVKRKLKKD